MATYGDPMRPYLQKFIVIACMNACLNAFFANDAYCGAGDQLTWLEEMEKLELFKKSFDEDDAEASFDALAPKFNIKRNVAQIEASILESVEHTSRLKNLAWTLLERAIVIAPQSRTLSNKVALLGGRILQALRAVFNNDDFTRLAAIFADAVETKTLTTVFAARLSDSNGGNIRPVLHALASPYDFAGWLDVLKSDDPNRIKELAPTWEAIFKICILENKSGNVLGGARNLELLLAAYVAEATKHPGGLDLDKLPPSIFTRAVTATLHGDQSGQPSARAQKKDSASGAEPATKMTSLIASWDPTDKIRISNVIMKISRHLETGGLDDAEIRELVIFCKTILADYGKHGHFKGRTSPKFAIEMLKRFNLTTETAVLLLKSARQWPFMAQPVAAALEGKEIGLMLKRADSPERRSLVKALYESMTIGSGEQTERFTRLLTGRKLLARVVELYRKLSAPVAEQEFRGCESGF